MVHELRKICGTIKKMKPIEILFFVALAIGIFMGGKKFINSVARREPPAEYKLMFAKYTRIYALPKNLLRNIAWQESRYKPDAVSPVGARGLMQFMPATAAEWGVDVNDPESSIAGAARYLVWLRKQTGSWERAVAAYNGGIGNLKKRDWDISKMPRETRDYVAAITPDMYASDSDMA